jgi:aminomethyltransferase
LLRGIEVEGRRPPREGQNVLIDGKPVGTVTSGNFSPMLERGIALAFLPPNAPVGDSVEIDQRGTLVPGVIVKPPFFKR